MSAKARGKHNDGADGLTPPTSGGDIVPAFLGVDFNTRIFLARMARKLLFSPQNFEE